MQNITLEGKIVIFKTIAISKFVFESFITTVPKYVAKKLENMRKAFLWNNSTPKIKHETLCNDYKVGRLRKVGTPNKFIALQCSWIRRLYNDSFHDWKLIPLYSIEK